MRNNDGRRAYSMGEFGHFYGISRDTIKRHVKNGLIKTIRVGGRILIPASELDRIEHEGVPKKP
jgi:excisionase family DNA binding protein